MENLNLGPSSSPIENLPNELLWKVFDDVPESVINLRSTSTAMKAAVENYITKRTIDKIANEIDIIGKPPRINLGGVEDLPPNIRIRMERVKSSIFELRLKLHRNAYILRKGDSIKRKSWPTEREYFVKCDSWEEAELMFELLRDSIGGLLSRVEFIECNTESSLLAIPKILAGIAVEYVMTENHISDDVVNHLPTALASSDVDRMSLFVCHIWTSEDPVNLLLRLSSTVRALAVYQQTASITDEDTPHFLGQYNVDWAPIFTKMLSNKLDNLRIENDIYKDYLSDESIDGLKKSLPTLGKNIFFSTTCSNEIDDGEYEKNEHIVKVESEESLRSGETRRLIVKHPSVKEY